MVTPTCVQLSKWRDAGLSVKFIHMDNAGENLKLHNTSDKKEWKLGIDYEYTSRNTPQQNHLVELGFAVLANCGRALMIRANVPMKERYMLFREAFMTATLLDGLITIAIGGVTATRYVHFEHAMCILQSRILRLHSTYKPGVLRVQSLRSQKQRLN